MAKQNQLDKAIQALKSKREVLDLAIAQLEQHKAQQKPAAKPRKATPRLVGETA